MFIEKDRNAYVVVEKTDIGESVSVMSPGEIFSMMDMSDCYDIEIDVFLIRKFGEPPQRCRFRRTWHDTKDPLKMVICDEDGTVLDIGYGTDH